MESIGNQLKTREEWLEEELFVSIQTASTGTIGGQEYYLKDQTLKFNSYLAEVFVLMKENFTYLYDDVSSHKTDTQELEEKIEHAKDTAISLINRLSEDLANQNKILKEVCRNNI